MKLKINTYSVLLFLFVFLKGIGVYGQYTTSLSLGFDVYAFTDCGDGQTCSASNQSGQVKMFIDRIYDNKAYFRIIKCGTNAQPVSTIDFGFPEDEIVGSFYILKDSPCGTIVSQTVVRKGGWYYELEVPISPNQLETTYYGVYFPNSTFYGSGTRHVSGGVSITGYLPAPALNAPVLLAPINDALTATPNGVILYWDKNGNPAGTDYQIDVVDETTNTVVYDYVSCLDVSQKGIASGISAGNRMNWRVRAVKSGYLPAESATQYFHYNNSSLSLSPIAVSPSTGSTSSNFTFSTTVNFIVKLPYPPPVVDIEFIRPDASTFTVYSIGPNLAQVFTHTQSLTQAGTYQYRFVVNQLNRPSSSSAWNSLTVTGTNTVNPVVNFPNTNASLVKGQAYNLLWSFPNYTGNISIELTSGPTSTTPVSVLYNLSPNDGSQPWLVPTNLAPGQYRIKLYNTGAGQNGNQTFVGYSGVFNIVSDTPTPPVVTISSPQANATLNTGATYPINWSFTNFSGSVSLELTQGSSSTSAVNVIASPTTNDGTENWTVPSDLASGQYRIKIYNTGAGQNGNPTYVGYSGVFNVVSATPVVTVSNPIANANLNIGSAYPINWTLPNYSGPVSIELTAGASSTTAVRVLYDPTNNDGTESWTVPSDLTVGQYRVKIYNTGAGQNGNPTYVGYSGVFNIVNSPPVISISSPQANATLSTGTSYPINWSFTNYPYPISLELTAGASSTVAVKVIINPTTNDGTENWTVPTDLASGQYRVKIYNTGAGQNGNPTYVGYSGVFNIVNNTPFVEKNIGYLPTYQWGAGFNADYLGIFTHINLSFINPTISGGVFQTDAQGDYIWSFSDGKSIADAKAKMSLWISNGFTGQYFFAIGGAEASNSLLAAYRTALNSSTNRTKLLNGLNKFMLNFDASYKVKGIDMDLEYTAMNIGGYNDFVQLLADNLHVNNYQISVAAEYKYPAGLYIQNDNGTTTQKVLGSMINDVSLSKIDWLNMMSYDYAQANDLSSPKLGLNHSPYSLVQRDYAYWHTTRSLPNSKIVCGIPLYGRETGGSGVEIAYRDLKCKEVPAWYNPDLALRDNDQVSVRYCYYGAGYSQKPSVLTVYQNGRGTLQQKYDFVSTNNLAGKMFWAIGNDIWEDKNQALLGPLFKSACVESLAVNGQINSTVNNPYKGQNIVSNATIQTGLNIEFNAENSIELNPPFQTQSNTVFKAQIKACDQASSSVSNSQILGNLKLENK